MTGSLDGRQLRSGPDAEHDLTLSLDEWRGEVWGILSGAGFSRGYVTGTRTGDELQLGVTALGQDGTATAAVVHGTVLPGTADDELAVELNWALGPRRLVAVGWADPDGPSDPLDERAGPTGQVRLVEIDEGNFATVARVKVAPHQNDYVADNMRSIAEAHVYDPPGWYRAVYDGDVCVGFVMLCQFDDPGHKLYQRYHGWYLWRLLIGAQHQRRGYGTQVIRLVCDHIDHRGGPRRLSTSWNPAVGGPERFYRGLGFEPTGEVDDGEVVAVLHRWADGSTVG